MFHPRGPVILPDPGQFEFRFFLAIIQLVLGPYFITDFLLTSPDDDVYSTRSLPVAVEPAKAPAEPAWRISGFLCLRYIPFRAFPDSIDR